MNSNGQYSDYSEFDTYSADYAPAHTVAPDLKTVADGDYDCEFVEVRLDRIDAGTVVRASIRMGGRVVDHTYWLNRQQGVNAFAAEMAALGFPAQSWGNGPGKTPLSRAIPQCVASLKGIRFRATKSSRAGKAPAPGQPAPVYHELFIAGRLGASAPMPAVTQARAAQPTMAASGVGTGVPDDCPF